MKLRTVTLIEEAVLEEFEGSTETTPFDTSMACVPTLTQPDVTLVTDKGVDKVDPGCSIDGTADRASMETGSTFEAQFRYALANRSQPVRNCSRYSTVYAADRQKIPSVRLITTPEQYQHMKDAHDFPGGTVVGTSCCGRKKIQGSDTKLHNVLLHGPTGAPRKTVRKSFRKKTSGGRSNSCSKKGFLSNLRKLARSEINSSDLNVQLVSMSNGPDSNGQTQDPQVTDKQVLEICEKQSDRLLMNKRDKSKTPPCIISTKQHTTVSESTSKLICNPSSRDLVIHALKSHRIQFQSILHKVLTVLLLFVLSISPVFP
ncbi:hypothetical protein P879_08920 [Paragonimus westermani]|uniref:Uncharacterized protein n=1 Tax=Paragonimus westermani TaxID=34504 RepID=A0A8T0DDX2_9TREM|nr:hypothetical protein P879_08920 [Paragonimus westermani]